MAGVRSTDAVVRPVAKADEPAVAPLGPDVRYLLRLGDMRNGSGVGGDDLGRVLRDAARVQTRRIKEAAVVEDDGSLVQRAGEKHVPVITFDGLVLQLTEARASGGLQVRARVEFTLRRGQVLKASLSGAATSFGASPSISDAGRRRLEGDAIEGAVQSALQGADESLKVATR